MTLWQFGFAHSTSTMSSCQFVLPGPASVTVYVAPHPKHSAVNFSVPWGSRLRIVWPQFWHSVLANIPRVEFHTGGGY